MGDGGGKTGSMVGEGFARLVKNQKSNLRMIIPIVELKKGRD